MNIYIDFDDVICETAFKFSYMAKELLGIDVPYENILYFNLKKSFNLNDEQYDRLMVYGHTDDIILSYEETPGACETINSWISRGHNVFIMTGRPASVYEQSLRWLREHGLESVRLICVDKYGRDAFLKNSSFSIRLDEFYKMSFDFAVEDSPEAFSHLLHFPSCTVAVYDRPWNRNSPLPGDNFRRCINWAQVDEMLAEAEKCR